MPRQSQQQENYAFLRPTLFLRVRATHRWAATTSKRARKDSEEASNTKRPREDKKTGLLDLPDEALTHVFRYLNAFDTIGTFQGPRQAFPLAQANKRLLGVFTKNLIRITPQILNDTIPTLWYKHMASVLRLAGKYVRELHLSEASNIIAPNLLYLCPELRVLRMELGFCIENSPAVEKLVSKLRVLAINRPCAQTFGYLLPPPEELSLTEVPMEYCDMIIEILKMEPPKRFHLEITGEALLPQKLIKRLQEACTKMEELTVKIVQYEAFTLTEGFHMEQLLLDMQSGKRDSQSKCKKLVLHGEGLGQLIRHANPLGMVEISRCGQTLVNDGGSSYIKAVLLTHEYLQEPYLSMMDKIDEITIPFNRNERWEEVLKDRHFKRVLVESTIDCDGLSICADIVEFGVSTLSIVSNNYKWLHDVHEVRILEKPSFRLVGDCILFLKALIRLFKRFKGNRVLLQSPFHISLRRRSEPLRRLTLKTLKFVDEFEERGGDAETVRVMLNNVLPQTAALS